MRLLNHLLINSIEELHAKKKIEEEKETVLSYNEVDWLLDFFNPADILYITPSRKDHVYIGKRKGINEYQQKRYLLWTLRKLFDIISGTDKIENSQDSFPQKF